MPMLKELHLNYLGLGSLLFQYPHEIYLGGEETLMLETFLELFLGVPKMLLIGRAQSCYFS
jgi:hypothetical protein